MGIVFLSDAQKAEKVPSKVFAGGNRVPFLGLQNEFIFSRKLNLKQRLSLRVWVCPAFTHVPKANSESTSF